LGARVATLLQEHARVASGGAASRGGVEQSALTPRSAVAPHLVFLPPPPSSALFEPPPPSAPPPSAPPLPSLPLPATAEREALQAFDAALELAERFVRRAGAEGEGRLLRYDTAAQAVGGS